MSRLDVPFLMGGVLVAGSVFAWPSMGRLFWEYAERGDYPVVRGALHVTSAALKPDPQTDMSAA